MEDGVCKQYLCFVEPSVLRFPREDGGREWGVEADCHAGSVISSSPSDVDE